MSSEVKALEKKVRKKIHKHDVSFAELRRTVDATTKAVHDLKYRVDKTSRTVDRTSRTVDKVAKLVGGMGNNHGKVAEYFFAKALRKNPVFGGERYDSVFRNLHPTRGGEGAEFDIVLANSTKVVLIEVKYCAHPDDLRKLVEQKVSEFREWCPTYVNHEVYLGIASLSFPDDVVEEAQRLGVGVLCQVGDTLEITDGKLKPF
ncbi:hypothetical protein FACS1894170_12610 [Planctomycetales bacterium]|nr:hypothetical protein FACS1894170_12610 [Planctomycetales bacterium]